MHDYSIKKGGKELTGLDDIVLAETEKVLIFYSLHQFWMEFSEFDEVVWINLEFTSIVVIDFDVNCLAVIAAAVIAAREVRRILT